MTKKTLPKWTDERTDNLVAIVGSADNEVTQEMVAEAAEALETTTRSVSSKLRKLNYEVEPVAAAKKSFTEEQEAKLKAFLEANEGAYTYAEIAAFVFDNVELARKVQGKILSMEMTGYVKKTEPKEATKTYTDEEEETIFDMVSNGAYLEDIAENLNKTLNSVRGKALSMIRSRGITMPKQRDSKAKKVVDALEELGDTIKDLTVEEIAEKIEKSARGVKVMLTHRGLTSANYDGAKRAEKIKEKKEAA